MKLKLLCFAFTFAFLYSQAQVEKFSKGDIGLRAQLNYTGSLQGQVTVSGFVTKRLEIGGTVSLTYGRTLTYFHNPLIDSISMQNVAWNYEVGVDPYIVYHFPMKSKKKNSKFDFYVGGLAWFSMGNSGSRSSTWNSNILFSDNSGSQVQLSPAYHVGTGFMAGCQYFISKQVAIGIQFGEYIYWTFSNNRDYLYQYSGNFPYSYTETPIKVQKGNGAGGFIGLSASYYFPGKKEKTSKEAPVQPSGIVQ